MIATAFAAAAPRVSPVKPPAQEQRQHEEQQASEDDRRYSRTPVPLFPNKKVSSRLGAGLPHRPIPRSAHAQASVIYLCMHASSKRAPV